MDIRNILRTFEIFYGLHLVHDFQFGYHAPRKIWHPWSVPRRRPGLRGVEIGRTAGKGMHAYASYFLIRLEPVCYRLKSRCHLNRFFLLTFLSQPGQTEKNHLIQKCGRDDYGGQEAYKAWAIIKFEESGRFFFIAFLTLYILAPVQEQYLAC
jgi:hypothetical protein